MKISKGRPIQVRMRDSLNGLRFALADDRSVRDHLFGSLIAALLLLLAPPPLALLVGAAILLPLGFALELLNGALEDALDRLHPEAHPLVGSAKDKASAAAFVVNAGAALIVLAALAL
jgi:diacylglycerol kinase (ATP)